MRRPPKADIHSHADHEGRASSKPNLRRLRLTITAYFSAWGAGFSNHQRLLARDVFDQLARQLRQRWRRRLRGGEIDAGAGKRAEDGAKDLHLIVHHFEIRRRGGEMPGLVDRAISIAGRNIRLRRQPLRPGGQRRVSLRKAKFAGEGTDAAGMSWLDETMFQNGRLCSIATRRTVSRLL